jgi:major vault protein
MRNTHTDNDKKRGGNPKEVAPATSRDRTRVVRYRVPHNAAVQVYDYRQKRSRVVFGPDLVMLVSAIDLFFFIIFF